MGLGLYISAGIVQQYGGTIAVESAPGKESRFHFTIPYTVNVNLFYETCNACG
jgi:signal transduction histidine kinase